MLTIATDLINGAALWKIILASFAAGGGVAIMFGIMLLGFDRASASGNEFAKVANWTLALLAGAFCVGAVVVGIYVMFAK